MTMDDPLTGREREESGGGGQPAVPVALREVSKLYRHGRAAVRALDGVSAEFARYSFTAVMGPSGSGKSTLLHCATGLERPTSGTVRLAGQGWEDAHDQLRYTPAPHLVTVHVWQLLA